MKSFMWGWRIFQCWDGVGVAWALVFLGIGRMVGLRCWFGLWLAKPTTMRGGLVGRRRFLFLFIYLLNGKTHIALTRVRKALKLGGVVSPFVWAENVVLLMV